MLGCIEKQGEFLCPGNDVAGSLRVSSKEDCAQTCYDTPGCQAWTFGESSPPDTCWLKTSEECTGVKSGWVWGTRDCGQPNLGK